MPPHVLSGFLLGVLCVDDTVWLEALIVVIFCARAHVTTDGL